MARAQTTTAEYDLRQKVILDHASRLFATQSFLGTSVNDLAEACNMSKSLIYYYYPSKEDILYDVMLQYLESLHKTARAVCQEDLEPKEKFRELCRRLVMQYVAKVQPHKVMFNERDKVSARRQRKLTDIEREIFSMVEDILLAVRPGARVPRALCTPITMLFYGSINWTQVWAHADGPLDPLQIADLASELFLNGFLRADLPSAP